MNWLALALIVTPPDESVVDLQRPGEAMVWALDWDAPASCPTRAELVAQIRGYLPALDEPPLEVPRARLRVSATIESIEGGWQARVEMSGEHGASTRSFSASSCGELADAIALVAAVSLDPVVVARELADFRRVAQAEPETPDPPQNPPPSAPAPESALEPSAAPGPGPDPSASVSLAEPAERESWPAREFKIGLRLVGGGSYGPTTTGYGAIGAGVALFARRWRWSLDGGANLPRTMRSDQAAGRFWGWWIGTRGCVVPRREVVEFPLCGGLEAGQVRAVGVAPALNPQAANQPWLAGSLGAGVTWVITERVAVTADAAAVLPFLLGSFEVGDQTLQSVAPVGARATLGVELRL